VRSTSEQNEGDNYFTKDTALNDSIETSNDQDTTQTIEEPLIEK